VTSSSTPYVPLGCLEALFCRLDIQVTQVRRLPSVSVLRTTGVDLLKGMSIDVLIDVRQSSNASLSRM